MQINIKTSEANQEVVRKLTAKLPSMAKENVIARIALGYSLKLGKKFAPSDFNSYDSRGKEYKDQTLFDERYRDFYIALVCQHYGIYKTDENLPKYIKLHIDHGLEIMGETFDKSPSYTFMDFLKDNLESGISLMEKVQVSLGSVKNTSQHIDKDYYSSPIKINVGRSVKDAATQVILEFNNTALHSNSHIAIAGNSGTGKTQFALYLLRELYTKSSSKIKFIYLDFKGLTPEDYNGMKLFFDTTNTEYINIPDKPFPINPLSFIDTVNETNRRMGIDKFVDIVSKCEKIGPKQEQTLRDATLEAFKDKKTGEYPTLAEIYSYLTERMGDKVDTLTSLMDSLSAYNVFSEGQRGEHFINKNIYLSLGSKLPTALRFTSLFLIVNYIYNTFMNMDSAPIEDDTASMRYVLLIDEAHVIFKERKYQDILETMLREIRSKGVSIILLSQGIEEFSQKNFDFSTLCDTAFLLDIKDKTNTTAIKKFMGIGDGDGNSAFRSMEKIKKGQAISNLKEFKKGELFEVRQYYKDY